MLFLLLTTSYKNGMKKWSRFFLTVVLCLVIIVYEPLAVLASCEIMEGSDESQFITEFTDGNSDAGETVQDRNDDMDLKNEDSDMNQDEFTDGENSEITGLSNWGQVREK